MRILTALAGGLMGGVIGYLVGAVVGCDWLYPTSNLCGIYGAFFTGPLGFLAGAWRAGSPRGLPGDDLR